MLLIMSYTREQAEEVLRDFSITNPRVLTGEVEGFLDHKFPKKVSGWYKTKNYEKYLFYIDFENDNAYGFDLDGKWDDEFGSNCYSKNDDYLATQKEVEQRLIEEAKRRGFVEGALVKCVRGYGDAILTKVGSFNELNQLWHFADIEGENICIFANGKWAEIIEQPETELSRTIKKAEKIAAKLEKLINKNK